MDDYINEAIEQHLKQLAITALTSLSGHRTPENTIITTSGGLSVTVIPIELDYVMQSFISESVYNRIKAFWAQIIRARLNIRLNLAQILEFYDNSLMIKVQKVQPLNEYTTTIPTMLLKHQRSDLMDDIDETITALGRIKVVHGDPRLDNIGWSETDQKYVLFDYDNTLIGASYEQIDHDHRILQKSMDNHTALTVCPDLGSR
jgi:tRNA A-37 threonylcarbamoyl transferase component Bud32